MREKLYQFCGSGAFLIAIVLRQPGYLWSDKVAQSFAAADTVRRYIRPKLVEAGYGWVDFHVMRRTHSTLMRGLGVDPKVVADQQGHTLDVKM